MLKPLCNILSSAPSTGKYVVHSMRLPDVGQTIGFATGAAGGRAHPLRPAAAATAAEQRYEYDLVPARANSYNSVTFIGLHCRSSPPLCELEEALVPYYVSASKQVYMTSLPLPSQFVLHPAHHTLPTLSHGTGLLLPDADIVVISVPYGGSVQERDARAEQGLFDLYHTVCNFIMTLRS